MNPYDIVKRHGSGSAAVSEMDRRDSASLIESSFPPYRENAESPQEAKKRFPISVLFIVLNEFCERFSYYGLRAVLAIYFSTALGMNKISATVVFHAFVVICYFSPLLGSMLADGYLGKFRTVYYVSIMYSLGSLLLAASSIPLLMFPMLPMSMVALFLIALGTGGIKPCVAAFGGDQFDNDQVKQRDRFYFIYYFAINAGSLISMFITPMLKADVSCFGQETCYPLAFAVPAVLMVLSIVVFVAGYSRYRMQMALDNLLVDVPKCIWASQSSLLSLRTIFLWMSTSSFWTAAIRITRRRASETRDKVHWLDYADDKFDQRFLSDVKAVLRVWFLYVPLPVFWALFDQQGSLWTFQAQALDGRLLGSNIIMPEQMQIVNPMLIVLLIPVFDSVIYPCLATRNFLTKPLKRMFVGGLIAALASFAAAILQIGIEKGYPSYPTVDHTDIVFINNGPCVLQLESFSSTMEVTNSSLNATLDDKKFFAEYMNVLVGETNILNVLVKPTKAHTCKGIPGLYPVFGIYMKKGSATTVVIYVNDIEVKVVQRLQLRKKPVNGKAAIRLAYNLAVKGYKIMLLKKYSKINCTFVIDNSNTGITTYGKYGTDDDYCNTEPGTYILYLPNGTDHLFDTGIEIHPQNGGRYIYNIYASGSNNEKVSVNYYLDVPANNISMLWQIPQYVLITCAEVMFAITGLQFSYSQAPVSMRAVLQASFLLTVAFGNVIIIVISKADVLSIYSYQYFVYAAIMAVIMLIFAYLCKNYVYVTVDSEGNIVYTENEEDEQSRTQRTTETNPDVHVRAVLQ